MSDDDNSAMSDNDMRNLLLFRLRGRAIQELRDLLSWIDYPRAEPLTAEWLEATKKSINTGVGNAIDLAFAAKETGLAKTLRKARSKAFELAALLYERPELSALRYDLWTSERRRKMVEDLAAIVGELEAETRRIEGKGAQESTPDVLPLAMPTHSEDYTSVNWYGMAFQFVKGHQAESVRILWQAWEDKTPTLSEKTIGEKIGSAADSFQLAKVFRKKKKSGGYENHPAWGRMIVRSAKGIYQLLKPTNSK